MVRIPSKEVEALAEASFELVVTQLERALETLRSQPHVRSPEMRAAVNDLAVLAEMAGHLFPTLPSVHRK